MTSPAPTPPPPSVPAPKRPRTNTAIMWVILAIAAIAAAAPFLLVSGGKDVIAWRTDFDAAVAEAKPESKALLIYFTADWCGPCKVMKREVFSKERVKRAVETACVPVRIDTTTRSEATDRIGARFGIKYLPTYLLVTTDGEELRRATGAMDEEKFLAWLRGGS